MGVGPLRVRARGLLTALLLGLLLVPVLAVPSLPARAADVRVPCSVPALTAAVATAATTPQDDRLVLSRGCTYLLPAPLQVPAGGGELTLDGDGAVLDGAGRSGLLVVETGALAVVRRLTLTRGAGTDRDGDGVREGGAVLVLGELALEGSTVRDNRAGTGGGVLVAGTASVLGSTFTGNAATVGGGAIAVLPDAALDLQQSTLTGNTAPAGAAVSGSGALVLGGVTVVDNDGPGLQLAVQASLLLQGTVLAGNAPDCLRSAGPLGAAPPVPPLLPVTLPIDLPPPFADELDTTLARLAPPGTSRDVGANADGDRTCPLAAGSLRGVQPLLGPLRDNGGDTATMLPGPGSVLLDALPVARCGTRRDQRGLPRPVGSACDIGAVESRGPAETPARGAGPLPDAGAGAPPARPGLPAPDPLPAPDAGPVLPAGRPPLGPGGGGPGGGGPGDGRPGDGGPDRRDAVPAGLSRVPDSPAPRAPLPGAAVGPDSTTPRAMPGPDVGEGPVEGGGERPLRSSLARGLPLPQDVSLALVDLVRSGAVALGLVLLLAGPVLVVNKTAEGNRDRLRAGLRRYLPLPPLPPPRTRPPVVVVALTATLAGLLYSFLDPAAALDGSTARTALGLALGVALVGGSARLSALANLNRSGPVGGLQLFRGFVLVAAVCVVLCRLVGLEPGLVLGALSGFTASRALAVREESTALAVGYAVLAGVTVLGFLFTGPVSAQVLAGGGAGWQVLDTALATVVVAGVQALAFSLVPLTYLDGDVLRRGAPVRWAVLWGLGVVTLVHLVLEPGQDGAAWRGQESFLLALLTLYLASCTAFWAWFRLTPSPTSAPSPAPTPALTPALTPATAELPTAEQAAPRGLPVP